MVVASLWHQAGMVFRILCCVAAEVVLWTEWFHLLDGQVYSEEEECFGSPAQSS